MIGDTVSGSGPEARVHILVKPTRSDLQTNLVINTDRRTYHLELRATPTIYMPRVAWRYLLDEARARAALAQASAEASIAASKPASFSVLNFGYRLSGRAAWRPLRVYDDGRQTFIEFPPSVVQGDLPPLFIGAGKAPAELVNYRVVGRLMVVDRIFDFAELRIGDRLGQQSVRITRTGEAAP